MIEEMVNDAVDVALDSEDMEEEIEEEVEKVLAEIGGETAAQLPDAVRKEKLKQPAQASKAPEVLLEVLILNLFYLIMMMTSCYLSTYLPISPCLSINIPANPLSYIPALSLCFSLCISLCISLLHTLAVTFLISFMHTKTHRHSPISLYLSVFACCYISLSPCMYIDIYICISVYV